MSVIEILGTVATSPQAFPDNKRRNSVTSLNAPIPGTKSESRFYHIERYMDGEYRKYNSNSGFVDQQLRNTPQVSRISLCLLYSFIQCKFEQIDYEYDTYMIQFWHCLPKIMEIFHLFETILVLPTRKMRQGIHYMLYQYYFSNQLVVNFILLWYPTIMRTDWLAL